MKYWKRIKIENFHFSLAPNCCITLEDISIPFNNEFLISGFEYANINGYTFAINYERFQSLSDSAYSDSLLFKLGKKQVHQANFDVIYDPINNNKTTISYLKNFGNFNLKLNSNYSLFSKIPDYGANLEISGTF